MEEQSFNIVKNNFFMKGSDAFNVGEQFGIYDSGVDTSIHHHDFVEIVYFKSGIGTHIINDSPYDISSGSVCILNTGVKHHYHVTNDKLKAISVTNCIFYADFMKENTNSNKFIQEMYKTLFNGDIDDSLNYIQLNFDKNKDIDALFSILEHEYSNKDFGYTEVVKSTILSIIIKIFRAYAQKTKLHKLSLENKTMLELSLLYIKEHLSENLTLETISANNNFSSVYFNNIFKEYTGLTFKKYLQIERCKLACKLLKETSLPIIEICEKIGYSDAKHFFALFKKCVGMTPNKYRNS